MRMQREAFSQSHCSKELCATSKPKLRRASKQAGLPENEPSVIAVLSVSVIRA